MVLDRLGFSAEDFAVFGISGFASRMQAIRERLSPRLYAVGERLAPEVSRLCGRDHYPHVARHQRRSVSPPPETWVALGPSMRGYKMFPHLLLTVSRGGLHARATVRNECDTRARLAALVSKQAGQLGRTLARVDVRRYDAWDPEAFPEACDAAEPEFWKAVAARLALKGGLLDVGVGWPASRAPGLTVGDVVPAFRALLPLYKRLLSA
jgi:uncharacterized protein YktB (UPF0637 family)